VQPERIMDGRTRRSASSGVSEEWTRASASPQPAAARATNTPASVSRICADTFSKRSERARPAPATDRREARRRRSPRAARPSSCGAARTAHPPDAKRACPRRSEARVCRRRPPASPSRGRRGGSRRCQASAMRSSRRRFHDSRDCVSPSSASFAAGLPCTAITSKSSHAGRCRLIATVRKPAVSPIVRAISRSVEARSLPVRASWSISSRPW
jgi:hypothetical protein